MAFNNYTLATNIIGQLPDDPNDNGGLTAAELKEKFDENAGNLKEFINSYIIEALNSTISGSSGADNVGYGGNISGVTNIKEALDLIWGAGGGSIPPDGTITTAKLADNAVTPDKLADETKYLSVTATAGEAISPLDVPNYINGKLRKSLPVSTAVGDTITILDMCQVNTDKYVIAYRDTSTDHVYLAVASVNGSSLSLGTPREISSHRVTIKMCKIDTNKLGLVVADNYYSTEHLYGEIATVSGTTVSIVGTVTIAESANSPYAAEFAASHDTDCFIIVFNTNGYTYAVACKAISTALTVGSMVNITSSSPNSILLVPMTSTTQKIFYTDGTAIYARQLTVSVVTLTLGTVQTVITAVSNELRGVKVADNQCLVSAGKATGGTGTVYYLKNTGSTLSIADSLNIGTNPLPISYVDGLYVVYYYDSSASKVMAEKICIVSDIIKHMGSYQVASGSSLYAYYADGGLLCIGMNAIAAGNIIPGYGLATAAITAGSSGSIVIDGTVDAAGTAGVAYLDSNNNIAAYAVSDSRINVVGHWKERKSIT